MNRGRVHLDNEVVRHNNRTAQPRLRKSLVASIVLALSFATLVVMVYRGWEDISDLEWGIDYWTISIAFILHSLTLLTATLGWHLMFKKMAGSGNLKRDARIYILSNAAKRLPGGIWGAASRVYMYKLEGYPEATTLAVVVMEVFIITLANLLIVPFFVAFLPLLDWTWLNWTIWGLTLGGIAFLLHPRVLRACLAFISKRFIKANNQILRSVELKVLLLWLTVYAVVWLLGGLVAFSVASSIHPIRIEHLPAVMAGWLAAGTVSMLIYFLPSGLGVTELTLAAVLSAYVPAPVAVAAALAVRIFLTASESVWALILYKRQ